MDLATIFTNQTVNNVGGLADDSSFCIGKPEDEQIP